MRAARFVARAALCAAIATSVLATAVSAADVEKGLRDQIAASGSGTYFVELRVKANIGAAAGIADRDARRTFVYRTLFDTAQASQASLVSFLDNEVAGGRTRSYLPYYIANVVLVTSGVSTLDAIGARSDVASIRATRTYDIPEPTEGTLATEYGVDKIRAPEVWASFGNGAGAVVGNVDTGVLYTHSALVNQYRGNLGGGSFDHNYNWFDPTGTSPSVPADNNNHGSHTMGTMVGDDGAANQIGVAPGAKWIAAKGCASSSCADSHLLSAAQWMLAPYPIGGTPAQGDPSKAPDVVNNSWGGGGGNPWYQASVDAWRAAGIIPVFSAGNSGPGAGTHGSPGDYCNVLGIAATDINDAIASFSSRGPGAFAACTAKPDLAAPGVNVRSSIASGGYGNFNGTSMAAPHVAGCVALMVAASGGLSYDDIRTALVDGAVDLGTVGHDTSFGNGRIDCFEAVSAIAGPALHYQANTLSDVAGGDGDGIVEPGETISVVVDLASNAFPVTGISAVLSSPTAGITVGDPTATYPNAAASSVVTSDPPHYTYTVDPSVECGTTIGFDLAIAANEGNWTGSFSHPTGVDIGTEVSYASTDTPIPIPDNPAPAIVSTRNVPDDVSVGGIRITVNITHTFIGDLVVNLQSPAGTVVGLHNRGGGSADNLQLTYPDDAAPSGPGSLADFVGESSIGNWVLTVEDDAGVDIGTLNSWSLHVKDVDFLCDVPVPTCTDLDGDGYGNPGDASCSGGPETDCNDASAAVNPGATEVLFNGIDDDCDPATPFIPGCQSVTEGTTQSSPWPLALTLIPALVVISLQRRYRQRRPRG